MKEKLEKYLIVFAWVTISVFVVFGSIAKFAPSLAFQYLEISGVILDNLWLLIISTLIILFVGKSKSKKSSENPSNKLSILQATLMVVAVGIVMLMIAVITNWFSFGIFGILGGMIGTALFAFSNLAKKEKS